MDLLIVTNNPKVKSEYKYPARVRFVEGSFLDVLTCVRDCVHCGHSLITHPLAGNLGPDKTPYRSVVLRAAAAGLDPGSVKLIEESLEFCRNRPGKEGGERPEILEELSLLDFELVCKGGIMFET